MERKNFWKISYVVLEIIQKQLRLFFIKKWNKKYPDLQWKDLENKGQQVFSKISQKLDSRERDYFDKIMSSTSEEKWDITILGKLFLSYGLNLIAGTRRSTSWENPLRYSEAIDLLRKIRNEYFAHVPEMSCSAYDFTRAINDIKRCANRLFGKEVENEIKKVESNDIGQEKTMRVTELLKQNFQSLSQQVDGKLKLLL